MALRYAIATGNWSNPAIWNGGTLPTSADDVFANNFTVTIDGTFTVLTIRTTSNTTPAIVAGGLFTFANGGDLTCTSSNGIICKEVSGTSTVFFDLPSPSAATLRASCNFISGASINSNRAIFIQNTGTFNMVGNYDLNNGSYDRATIYVNASTTINIIGNISCSAANAFNRMSTIWIAAGTPIINITGNVSGGFSNSFSSGLSNGIYAAVFCTINITGNVTTNLAPSIFLIAGILNLIGNVTGGNSHPAIYNTTNAATIDLLGLTTSGTNRAAVEGLVTTLVKVRGDVINTSTYTAILVGRVVIDTSVISWQFKDSTNTITRTLYTVVGMPAASDVRFGTTYGGSNELTGTMRVPSAANVLQGVLVDNTVGTLLMTPAQCWNYLISSGFTPNSIGDRLQNASTVATTGGQIAAYNI